MKIDTTSDLTNQYVVLKQPKDDLNTATTKINFSWYPIASAGNYRFEIRQDSKDGALVFPATILTYDTIEKELKEGVYYWRVQAQNNSSTSPGTSRRLVVDTTNPGVPDLISPLPGDTLKQIPVVLEWERTGSSTAVVSDSILIATDSLFTKNLETFFSEELSYTMKNSDSGTYYWKVRSVDKAGNKSSYSEIRKFRLINEK